jgi:hypothetical protein
MESTGEWRGQAPAGEVDLSNFQKRTLNVFYGVYGFMLRVPKIMHVKHRPNQSGIFSLQNLNKHNNSITGTRNPSTHQSFPRAKEGSQKYCETGKGHRARQPLGGFPFTPAKILELRHSLNILQYERIATNRIPWNLIFPPSETVAVHVIRHLKTGRSEIACLYSLMKSVPSTSPPCNRALLPSALMLSSFQTC